MSALFLLPALLLQQATGEASPPPASPSATTDPDATAPDVNRETIDGRRRPGYNPALPDAVTQDNPGAVRAPPPEAFPTDSIPLPDRWRIMTGLCPAKGAADQSIFTVFRAMREVCHPKTDAYHQNVLKGDLPLAAGKRPGFLKGDDWFFTLSAISDTVLEPRTFPIPVGVQTTARPQSLDPFGKDASFVFSQTFLAGAGLTKGNTAFKPPEIEYKLLLAFNVSYVQVPEKRVLFVEPSKGTHRWDHWLGVQELFIDYHLRNVSERYDFDSLRFGIQPFQSDFRGFLFNDQNLGIRLFGNRDDNRVQYNLAAFWRLEKDTNSGLNSVIASPRKDWVLTANLYRQDFFVPGLTAQFSVTWNRNREQNDIEIDDNGFPVRPALLGTLRGRKYDVVYLGQGFDGHVGRVNLTTQLYAALGRDRNSSFTDRPANIRAFMGAAELSLDRDWARYKLSALYASGDGDPYDNTEGGFDAILENPLFAGADTSYWIRQSIPFAGGGRVISISGRNGLLNSLRSSKDQGQSNFNNPGTALIGAGGDFDLAPTLRVSANANHLWFANTTVLQTLRNEGTIPKSIGWDLSAAAVWRPDANQNIVFRLSGAMLLPGSGFRDLFDNVNGHRNYYSVLGNAILSF